MTPRDPRLVAHSFLGNRGGKGWKEKEREGREEGGRNPLPADVAEEGPATGSESA